MYNEIPLELIDLICNKLPLKILINNGEFILPELNIQRIKKYWRNSDIYQLIADNDIHGVKYLIAKNHGENYTRNDLRKMVEKTCEHGYLEILNFLMNLSDKNIYKNSNINSCKNLSLKNNKPLLIAITKGYLDIVKYLIENNHGSINYQYKPVTRAVKHDQLNVLKYLVEKGANIKACEEHVINLTIYNGNLDMLKYLVEIGVNIRFKNDDALTMACRYGELDILKYLISLGLDIKRKRDSLIWMVRRSAYYYVYIEKYLESLNTELDVSITINFV
jgi:ankyrin repeat protein